MEKKNHTNNQLLRRKRRLANITIAEILNWQWFDGEFPRRCPLHFCTVIVRWRFLFWVVFFVVLVGRYFTVLALRSKNESPKFSRPQYVYASAGWLCYFCTKIKIRDESLPRTNDGDARCVCDCRSVESFFHPTSALARGLILLLFLFDFLFFSSIF